MRPGYLYILGVEDPLEAEPQLPHHRPLLERLNITQNFDVYPGITQFIHPQHPGRIDNQFTPVLVRRQFLADSIDDADGVLKVGTIAYRDIEVDPGKFLVKLLATLISPSDSSCVMFPAEYYFKPY